MTDQSMLTSHHHMLTSLVGNWEGATRTWLTPDKLTDESPTRGTIRPILGGRFVMFEYQSAMMSEPIEGMAIIGYNSTMRRFECAWVDTYHMGTGIMCSVGEKDDGGFNVLGQYEDPSGGLPWGWRTELTRSDADHFTMTAYNITPGGDEAKAVETTFERSR